MIKFVFFNTHIHIYIWPNLFRIGLRTLMAKMCLDHLLLFETTLPISFSQVLFFFPEGLSSIVKKFKKLSKVEMRPISQEHQSIPERRWSSFYPFQCKNLSTKIWKSCWRQPSKSLGLGYRVWLQSGDADMEGEITTYKARRPSSDTKVGRIGMCSPGLACVFYVTWVCM